MDLWELFEYQVWADEQIFYFLDQISEKKRMQEFEGYTSIKDRMEHIVLTLDLWYERLNGNSPSSLPDYYTLTTDEIIEEWRELNTKLQTFFSESHPTTFTYENTKGQQFENAYEDVALHLINHTTQYRSQIIMMIRMLGYEVENTDYIYFKR